jgi:hypothetical protein
MMQGIATAERVRLLLEDPRHACYHVHRRQVPSLALPITLLVLSVCLLFLSS